jgi:insertion element IS1 protein InsB
VCPTCQSDRLVHNGSATGKPTKPWKPWGDQCTRSTPRGTPLKTQSNAGLFYRSGLSMHRSAFLLRVSAQSILNGIRACAKAHAQKPAPTGRILILALDAMGHYLKKKRGKRWMWQALDPETGQRLDWECGRRAQATVQKMVDRRTQWDIKRYCTAHWAPYAALIPQGKLACWATCWRERTVCSTSPPRSKCTASWAAISPARAP